MLARVILFFVFSSTMLQAQPWQIKGIVRGEMGPLPMVSIRSTSMERMIYTDAQGTFSIVCDTEDSISLVFSLTGYLEKEIVVYRGHEAAEKLEVFLERSAMPLPMLIVSADRSVVSERESITRVDLIPARIFAQSQSSTLAQGLRFSQGLRVENSCQSCGFNQLLMNGLAGPYTQVLINSRPIYSALAAVYGLELLPASMIDRVEVVRGAGSVLHGGSAIAGSVNIITQKPTASQWQIESSKGALENGALEGLLKGSLARVDKAGKKGINFFGQTMYRAAADFNNDSITDRPLIRQLSVGADGFYRFNGRNKLSGTVFFIREHRRGGSHLDRLPHEASLAEQLDHWLPSLSVNWEQEIIRDKIKAQAYTSWQWVHRNSYYGAGGRKIAEGEIPSAEDSLALNAYGQSADYTGVLGYQWEMQIQKNHQLLVGTEWVGNRLRDAMPGYGRAISQQSYTGGAFLLWKAQWTEQWKTETGLRFDRVRYENQFLFQQQITGDRQIWSIPVPRLALRYQPNNRLIVRASYAQGYRTPQAFNEDLHIEMVGGNAQLIVLDPALREERSGSANVSVEYNAKNHSLTAEAFHTRLRNAFVLSDPEVLSEGLSMITRRNGGHATVAGVHAGARSVWSSKFNTQVGLTMQMARFDAAELLWSDAQGMLESVQTREMLRTPHIYGNLMANYAPHPKHELNINGLLTGPMWLQKQVDAETGRIALMRSPWFYEQGLKWTYKGLKWGQKPLHFYAGVQNMFNAFQRDLPVGPERDSAYIYGPLRPRFWLMGLVLKSAE